MLCLKIFMLSWDEFLYDFCSSSTIFCKVMLLWMLYYFFLLFYSGGASMTSSFLWSWSIRVFLCSIAFAIFAVYSWTISNWLELRLGLMLEKSRFLGLSNISMSFLLWTFMRFFYSIANFKISFNFGTFRVSLAF